MKINPDLKVGKYIKAYFKKDPSKIQIIKIVDINGEFITIREIYSDFGVRLKEEIHVISSISSRDDVVIEVLDKEKAMMEVI